MSEYTMTWDEALNFDFKKALLLYSAYAVRNGAEMDVSFKDLDIMNKLANSDFSVAYKF